MLCLLFSNFNVVFIRLCVSIDWLVGFYGMSTIGLFYDENISYFIPLLIEHKWKVVWF